MDSEERILDQVSRWWAGHEMHPRSHALDSFIPDCESFLGSMICTIQTQSTDLAALSSQMAGFVRSSSRGTGNSTQPGDPMSRFSFLAQGLRNTTAPSSAPSTSMGSSDPPNLVASVHSLQHQVKELNLKLATVSLENGNCCVRFGNVGFRAPRDLLPHIQAQMLTNYFGCFVNGAILME